MVRGIAVSGATRGQLGVGHDDVVAHLEPQALEGGHIGLAGAHVAQLALGVVALHIHHDHVGELQGVV